MYPMLCEGVEFRISGKENEPKCYYVQNANGEEFRVNRSLFKALKHADGTRPLLLPNHGEEIIPELKRYGLVHTNRLIKGILFSQFIILPVSERRAKKWRPLCKILNGELSSVACMMLIISIFLCTSTYRGRHLEIEMDDLNICLYTGLYVLSVLLHEFGHLIAGIAYKYPVKEVGVIFFLIIPIAAYVRDDNKTDTVKDEYLQFVMAGLEVNLLLAGIFFIAAVFCEPQTTTFFAAVWTNISLIISNLIPTEILRTDGTRALNTVLECESVFDLARKWLGSRKRRKKLVHKGLLGIACMAFLSFVFVVRFLYWFFVIGFNVYVLFLC